MNQPAENAVTVRLKPGQEKRLQAGHLWVFSNEIDRVEGQPKAGDLAEVYSASGGRLGTAFYNPSSLIACRLLSADSAAVDSEFFRKRLSAALAYREKVCPGESAYRLCFGESDFNGVNDKYLLMMRHESK